MERRREEITGNDERTFPRWALNAADRTHTRRYIKHKVSTNLCTNVGHPRLARPPARGNGGVCFPKPPERHIFLSAAPFRARSFFPVVGTFFVCRRGVRGAQRLPKNQHHPKTDGPLVSPGRFFFGAACVGCIIGHNRRKPRAFDVSGRDAISPKVDVRPTRKVH